MAQARPGTPAAGSAGEEEPVQGVPEATDAQALEFGLTCYGKPAARGCSEKRHQPARVFLVDELGNPAEEGFEHEPICEDAMLHGCVDQNGQVVIPFIHTAEFGKHPFKFFPSGFALVLEAFRGSRNAGGYYYVNADYSKRLEASAPEGIPEIWFIADGSEGSYEFVSIGRYEKDGLIGFLDINKGIVTPAKFTAAYGFWIGTGGMKEKTLVCEDCHPERWSLCAPPEAHCTGHAYMIDRNGRRLKQEPPKEYGEYWWCKTHPGRRDPPEELTFCPW